MDWVAGKQTIFELLKKYRFAIIVLLAGIALMAFPYKEEASENPVPASQEINNQDVPLQEALEEILGKISGAGKVSVLLTQAAEKRPFIKPTKMYPLTKAGITAAGKLCWFPAQAGRKPV